MTNDKVIAILNELIETSIDGAQGFQSCAQEVKEPELKSVFLASSQRCRNGAIDLQDQVRRLGGDPVKIGSAAGTAHRTWVDSKAAISGKDPGVILAEVEAGEKFAEKRYREALEKNLPSEIRAIIELQYTGLQEKLNLVRELKTRCPSAARGLFVRTRAPL